MTKKTIEEKISGCLFAGAIGDALGYPIEFDYYHTIQQKYGREGIKDLVLTGEKAIVSDDTQMTLFTIEGMIQAYKNNMEDVETGVYISYLQWLQTQRMESPFPIPLEWKSELVDIPEMNYLRAPGNTCLSALSSGKMGTLDQQINNSKGCGGVMRTAPLGFLQSQGSALLNGAKVAAITHGHPMGFISAGMLSDIVNKIIYGKSQSLKMIIQDFLKDTVKQFREYSEIHEFEQLIMKAIDCSEMSENDVECIETLGGGWIGEEALAIAIYSALKYQNDLRKAITVSVNHSGDSDSTGAITGNIIGAYLGIEAIPAEWLENIEMADVMRKKIKDIMDVVCDEQLKVGK